MAVKNPCCEHILMQLAYPQNLGHGCCAICFADGHFLRPINRTFRSMSASLTALSTENGASRGFDEIRWVSEYSSWPYINDSSSTKTICSIRSCEADSEADRWSLTQIRWFLPEQWLEYEGTAKRGTVPSARTRPAYEHLEKWES